MIQNTRNIVRLLIIHEHFVLLAKALDKEFFFLPGGGIEYNESIYSAAQRELQEELSISKERIKILEPLGLYEHSWDDNGSPFHELNIICPCLIDNFSHEVKVKSFENHLAFEWVSLNNLNKINIKPEAFKTLIPHWLKQKENKTFFASSMYKNFFLN